MFTALLFAPTVHAWQFFVEGIDWRATETNDWCYVNSEQLPNQTIDYKTIDFSYAPGFRIGAVYTSYWDALVSYTHLYTTANDSAVGNIRPAFSGSVTKSPTGYLFTSAHVNQAIDYNILDLDVGRAFHPTDAMMLHPIVGVMGGWINQSIHAHYAGSTTTNEHITNNFAGFGPKVGVDSEIALFSYNQYTPKFFIAFASAYLFGHWDISDFTKVVQTSAIANVNGSSKNSGALTLQGATGIKLDYKNWNVKLAYEISDWFNQSQFFDNDTGTHNNDLVLQGLTLGVSYSM